VSRIPAAYAIDRGRIEDFGHLGVIEAEAAALFPAEDLDPALRDDVHDPAYFGRAYADGRLWVARSLAEQSAVGFAMACVVDGSGHVAEVDVLPAHGRQGLGRALVEEVARWASSRGYRSLTLTTFRHLPWNGPFYARLGFVELATSEQGPELRAIVAAEAKDGLDPSKRMAMILDLDSA